MRLNTVRLCTLWLGCDGEPGHRQSEASREFQTAWASLACYAYLYPYNRVLVEEASVTWRHAARTITMARR